MTAVSRRAARLGIVGAAFFALGMGPCTGTVHTVNRGESIQDAVDAAAPGDTIVVRPGVYTAPASANAVVTVLKDGITLIGSRNAVIDASGVDYGVRVGSRQGGCLLGTWKDFSIEGFTIRNAGNSGLLIANVDRYSATHGTYHDNAEYGPYPVCSRDGYVGFNHAVRHDDAAIYVGQSDGALIEHNRVEDSTIGIEIENTINAVVRKNDTRENTAGIFVVVLPFLHFPFSRFIVVEENVVMDNNRDNPATPGSDLSLLPIGTGILNLGGRDVLIRRNVVQGNDSLGIAAASNPFSFLDPSLDRYVERVEIRDNVALHNGLSPDVDRALTPGADLALAADVLFPPTIPIPPQPDPTPLARGNCFEGNVYETEYVAAANAPGATLADFPCP